MPSSKRVNGNFTIWTGTSQVWNYNNPVTNTAATINRGNMDTLVKSANLIVYGDIIGMGAMYADRIYADITGNLVLPTGNQYGILYSDTNSNVAVSSKFTVNDANGTATMVGNITAKGTTGNITANNFIGNRAFLTSANIATINVTNTNVSGSIKSDAYLDLSGTNIVYGNANVFEYLSANTDTKQILLGSNGYITGSGYINITGNITGDYFLGNGRFLDGLPAGYSNANVANYLPTYTGNVQANTFIAIDNVIAGYYYGNGAYLTGLPEAYGNANVANYLPIYSGNISASNITVSNNVSTLTLNVDGLAKFSQISNLRIYGGNANQVLVTDGTGNVSFRDVKAIPGNNTGSFQYNQAGTLAGLNDFIYRYWGSPPSIQIANIPLTIDRANGNASNQFEIYGNARIGVAVLANVEDFNTGYLDLGGIDKLLPTDILGNVKDGQFLMVNGERLTYANAVKSIVTGNASQIVIGGNVMQPNVSIANSGVTAGTYGNANTAVTIVIGRDGRITSAANTSISVATPISNSTVNTTLTVPNQTLTIAGTARRVSSGLSGQTFTLSAPQDLDSSANFQVATLGVGTAPSGPAGTITAAANVNAGNFYTTGTVTSGSQNITGNIDVAGNINVTGNLNYGNVIDLVIGDPLIYIGANNTGNVYDLGMVVSYNDGTYQHGGWVRDASDGTWKLFGNVVAEPTTTIDFTNAIYQPMRAGAITATSGSYSLTLSVTGNITGGNLNSNGAVTGTSLGITANAIIGNISTAGQITATGNITGGNLNSNGAVTGTSLGITANAIIGNISTGGRITATGNITGGNLLTAGNVSGTYILGNGAFLTGLPAPYSNSNVSSYLASGAALTISTTGSITTTSSISGSSVTATSASLGSITKTGTSGVGDIGQVTNLFGTIYGTAYQALYADLAEKYLPDAEYEPGTVVIFGGDQEITASTQFMDNRIAGVVSTNPAYKMNSEQEGGVYVALQGRAPCKVTGIIKKGDMLVASSTPGVACAEKNPVVGSVIGKALQEYRGVDQISTIEIAVGRQ